MENPGRAEARQAFSIFIPLPYIKSAHAVLPYPICTCNNQTDELRDIGTEGIRPDAHARAAFATASLNELSRGVSRGGQPYTHLERHAHVEPRIRLSMRGRRHKMCKDGFRRRTPNVERH